MSNVHLTKHWMATDRSEAAYGVVLATDRRFDGFNVLHERKLLNELDPSSLGPIAAVEKPHIAAEVVKAVFNDREELGFWVGSRRHDKDRRGSEAEQFVNRANISLIVDDFRENSFTSVQVDEREPNHS